MLASRIQACLLAVTIALAAGLQAAPKAAPVTVTRQGPAWRLGNGIVEVVFDTEKVGVSEFRFADGPNVLHENGLYLDCNIPEGYYGFSRSENPTVESGRLCAQTPEYADVAVRMQLYDRKARRKFPLVFDWHVVLQQGDPGFYSYVVAEHQPGGGEMELEQLRFVLRSVERFSDYALTPTLIGHLADHPWKYTLSRRCIASN